MATPQPMLMQELRENLAGVPDNAEIIFMHIDHGKLKCKDIVVCHKNDVVLVILAKDNHD